MTIKYLMPGGTTNFQCGVGDYAAYIATPSVNAGAEFDVLMDALGAGGVMAVSSNGG